MKPTIGRIVIFKFIQEDTKSSLTNFAEEAPAIITRVWSDTCVNLKVFVDGEGTLSRTSVLEGDGPYSWHWPAREPNALELGAATRQAGIVK